MPATVLNDSRNLTLDSALRLRLEQAFDAIQILSPNSFRIVGGPTIEQGDNPDPKLDPHPLIEALWPALYHHFYCHIYRRDSLPQLRQPRIDPVFLARLSGANGRVDHWDPLWRVLEVANNGSVRVEKRGVIRWVLPGQYAFSIAPGRLPRARDIVALFRGRESIEAELGFYFVLGGAVASTRDEMDLLRFYFHIHSERVPWLLATLTKALDRYVVPFAFKCLSDPAAYERCDGAVLYCSKRYATLVLRILTGLREELSKGLLPGTPLFTKTLWPGLAIADDPGSGASFGQSRCVLLAQGILDAWLEGFCSREERLRRVAARFSGAGLSLARPHLKSGAVDIFEFPDLRGNEGQVKPLSMTDRSNQPDRTNGSRVAANPPAQDFLEVADRIGCRTCRDALWSGERCNWMIWSQEPFEGRDELVLRAGSPALFNGVAGIALFLAQLSRFTGDRLPRASLRGAIEHLQKSLEAGWKELPGYFLGPIGVGLTLVEIGKLSDDEAIAQGGMRWIERAAEYKDVGTTYDLLGGLAGIIPVLIGVRRQKPSSRLMEIARRHGDALLASAVRSESGLSWPSPLQRSKNLLGFAQGNAGIACALAALYREFGDSRFLEAARDALSYERHAFDAESGGWPDYSREVRTPTRLASHPVDWCRGAAGIGISRLRLLELWGEDASLLEELAAARQVVFRWLSKFSGDNSADFSLCHGLSGIADFLLQLFTQRKDSEARELAERIGRFGIEAIDRHGLPWPCGVPGGVETPDLMLGTAGVGYFYLRLHDPSNVSSILSVLA